MADQEQDFTKLPLSPIRTDLQLGTRMQREAVAAQDKAYQERIFKTWRQLNNDIRSPEMVKNLPVSYIYPMTDGETIENPGQCITIPLHGEGKLRISRQVFREKPGSSRGEYSGSTLVIGATTVDSRGKPVELPDVICSLSNWTLYSDAKIYPADDLPGHNTYEYLHPTEQFMALFDPSRDIDFAKMGTPSEAQSAILKALHVNPPPANP